LRALQLAGAPGGGEQALVVLAQLVQLCELSPLRVGDLAGAALRLGEKVAEQRRAGARFTDAWVERLDPRVHLGGGRLDGGDLEGRIGQRPVGVQLVGQRGRDRRRGVEAP
jgi:hypothetical protein